MALALRAVGLLAVSVLDLWCIGLLLGSIADCRRPAVEMLTSPPLTAELPTVLLGLATLLLATLVLESSTSPSTYTFLALRHPGE